MKKILIIVGAFIWMNQTYTAQKMLDLEGFRLDDAAVGGEGFAPLPQAAATPMLNTQSGNRRSLKRKSRPPMLKFFGDAALEKSIKRQAGYEREAIQKKLTSIRLLIQDIIEWEGPMLEQKETLSNVIRHINLPLMVNEHTVKMAYLATIEEDLIEKRLQAKHAIEEKYDVRGGIPRARFAADPVADVRKFAMNPYEMEAMHEGIGRWRERLSEDLPPVDIDTLLGE